jgi:uncharacterized protein
VLVDLIIQSYLRDLYLRHAAYVKSFDKSIKAPATEGHSSLHNGKGEEMGFRILSLDGGGTWALIEVRTLMKLYGNDATGHQVLKNFDLVAANSGGSLVLAGLVENLPLKEILQYFMDENKRRSIFSRTTKVGDDVLRSLAHIGPKYSASTKLPAIERLLPERGDKPLAGNTNGVVGPNGLPVHLLIVGFDYDRNRAVFFRSASAGTPDWGEGQPANVSLAAAVHASTNAPVNYFDAPAALPEAPDRFWDGGITGCNNPTVVAVIEAIVLGQPPTEIRVLTLGTGSVSLPLATIGAPASPFEAMRATSTLPNDLNKLATAILDDPPDAATFIAHAITGGNAGIPSSVVSRVVTNEPPDKPFARRRWRLDYAVGHSVAAFQYLCNIDMDALKPFDITYIDEYCTAWLEDWAPNQPIRPNGKTFDPWAPEIGYAKFSKAFAAWQQLLPPDGDVPTV